MLRLPVNHLQKCKILNILNVTIVRGIQSSGSESAGDKTKHYDIIVAGGGLVGTTLACSLGKNKVLSDKSILLLEGGPKFKGFEAGEYRNRVSALNATTIDLFKTVGAWDTIASMRYKPVKQMHVSDASSHALITFNKDNFAGDVAYIIENDLVLHAVYEQLDKLSNVEVQFASRIEDVTLPGSSSKKSEVVLKSGGKVTCDLLVSRFFFVPLKYCSDGWIIVL